MTDKITNVTVEGRNGTIVRLWLGHGRDSIQIDLRPTDPDTAFFADLVAENLRAALNITE